MPRIMAMVRPEMKADALWDELAPLFLAMAKDWADKVEFYEDEIVEIGSDVADVSQLDAAIVQQTLINIQLEPAIMGILNNFTQENAMLIKNIGTDLVDDVRVLTMNAIQFGSTTNDLQAAILAASEKFAGHRARLIARDQVGKLQGQIHMTRMEQAGLERYEWMTVGDERVRKSHRALDGEVRTWNQDPKPGQEIQCRCQPSVLLEDVL